MSIRRIRRLRFSLTDADLAEMARSLAEHDPFSLHHHARHALASERARRDQGEPPQDITLWSGVFETLPWTVQRRLNDYAARVSGSP
ncbi:MAG TPA: hypothetical protein VFQ62_11090 [Methylomirabilota bacterium]|jgi:hypothetical protein|nr:hypothetical protein [Methylomirabilota bacterium]